LDKITITHKNQLSKSKPTLWKWSIYHELSGSN